LQLTLDHHLDYISSQQSELSNLLSSYETLVLNTFTGSDGTSSSMMTGGGSIAGGIGTGVTGGVSGGSGGGNVASDLAREKAYTLAEGLNKQLDDMTSVLTGLVDSVNQGFGGGSSIGSGSTGGGGVITNGSIKEGGIHTDMEGTVDQIVEILNVHLTSLEWIDRESNILESKVKNLERIREAVTERSGEKRW